MNALLAKLNTPRLRALAASGLTSALVWLITWLGFQADAALQAQLSVFAGMLVGLLFRDGSASKAAAGISAIQDALPGVATTGTARVDGRTVAAIEALVAASPNPAAVIRPAVAIVNKLDNK